MLIFQTYELQGILNYDTAIKNRILKWVFASEQELKNRVEQILNEK
ncbi:hypothetical protein CMALT430_160020 [Carnobacterium maltaromaticum]|nr:hypothetical protein CMALT430_160020 [Carnobacterium maltaromaticum]